MTARDADDECLMTARAKGNHRDHHHHSSKRPKTPRMRAGADQRKFSQIIGVKLPAVIDDKLTEAYRQITSTVPLPPDFEYTHMFE
ncbi:unnamed protein product [Heligmosomoides polygyrus]|uniref:TAFII55_N domain-containing protein n=1 Tax=Heligmosomoides polygyrus TaxID=6339 RepID=A0A183FTU7_HELPZ|nr:unnamed protein product [Heligmosomoides polygyrus]